MTRLNPRKRPPTEEGSATTEFALLTLILVPTLLYAVFFFEMSHAKIKAHEASRYLVWEMTAAGLSDWQNEQHDQKFDNVKGMVLNEVKQRWGDDLDGASPNFTGGATGQAPITIDISFDAAELVNDEAGAFDVRTAGVDFGPIGETIDSVLGHFNFNERGKPRGTFKIKAKNKYLGMVMPIGYTEKMLLQDEFSLSSQQSLIADQWDLKKGDRVVEVEIPGSCQSDYCKQVKRMTVLGIADYLPNSGIQEFLSYFGGIHWFLSATVASIPMEGWDKSENAKEGAHDLPVADPPGHSPIRKAHANAWYGPPANVGSSAYKQTFQGVYKRLGPYYMGCKDAQQERCSYQQ